MKKEEIFDKWTKVGFFNKKNYLNVELAQLLENQRLHNEKIEDSDEVVRVKRISIPVVYRVFSDSVANKIGCLQAIPAGESEYFYRKDEKRHCYVVESEYKCTWREFDENHRHVSNLDAEAESTAVLAQEMTLGVDRWCLSEIRKVAESDTWDFDKALGDTLKEKAESLYMEFVKASAQIKADVGSEANWIVASPEVTALFETWNAIYGNYEVSLGVSYVANINNRWRLYKDPLSPTSQILLGYRGEGAYDAGLFLCPQTPFMVNLETKAISWSRALTIPNPKCFRRIDIANFIHTDGKQPFADTQ